MPIKYINTTPIFKIEQKLFYFAQFCLFLYIFVLGLSGKVFLGGSCRDDFCEKLAEASPVSDGASAGWLHDGPATGQG